VELAGFLILGREGWASLVRWRVALVLSVRTPVAAQVDSSMTWSLGMLPRQSVLWERAETEKQVNSVRAESWTSESLKDPSSKNDSTVNDSASP
jgi:hypothetical protein